ncbi:MAG: four helix bundle protein [Verrucomicrobia bacterium]|nr:MAG: four helix bundle protein [Verrucomicrobiota bacterium]
MTFDDWLKSVPKEITEDSIWKMEAYRLSLFLADLAWHDATKLMGDRRTLDLAGQLYSSVGSIEANIAEGYSRGSGRDRARFYEYALGSARESRGWYYKGRHVLKEVVAQHRMVLITHIARLLLKMVPDQRASGPSLHEDVIEYRIETDWGAALSPGQIAELLQDVPMG